MADSEFFIKQGDTGPSLEYTLSPATDLAGSTVQFIGRMESGNLKVNAAAVVATSASPGVVRYDWAVGDLSSPGVMRGEFRVTFGDGSIETFPNDDYIEITISENLE